VTTEKLTELLKKYLRVEVIDPDNQPYADYPYQPTVRVRLMWDGEVISEDEAVFTHNHGADV
jgi:hypothetical protein